MRSKFCSHTRLARSHTALILDPLLTTHRPFFPTHASRVQESGDARQVCGKHAGQLNLQRKKIETMQTTCARGAHLCRIWTAASAIASVEWARHERHTLTWRASNRMMGRVGNARVSSATKCRYGVCSNIPSITNALAPDVSHTHAVQYIKDPFHI